MRAFLDHNFLLYSKTAEKLYHGFAKEMPVIDYHNHLSPEQISNDHIFSNLTEAWLSGDHYKWRAMRANGVDENFITGNSSDFDKFKHWAGTVPYTLRNPLYHWTHLELQRYFNVHEILNENNAEKIYNECSAKLQMPEFSVRNLLRKMNVKVVCTTDDPADTLEHHKKIKDDGFDIKVLPAFRPDKAMHCSNIETFNLYVSQLEKISNININSYNGYLDALKSRHDFFATLGCTVSDHGLEVIYADDYTQSEIEHIFNKIRSDKALTGEEQLKFKSALLEVFAIWDHEKNWVQQYHLGALRNNNSRLFKQVGADAGADSIGDFIHGKALAKFLDKLDKNNCLAKTILYNLNPADNELFATMAGNFNDGSMKGKMQFGSGWWFLDQKDGMIKQLNALSSMGLLSRFVGMLTDSRSFLSFPRHEYFRRILCNIFGDDIEAGELPNDINWTGEIIRDICYNNAAAYFNWR